MSGKRFFFSFKRFGELTMARRGAISKNIELVTVPAIALPPGTPAWVTPQLVERTLRVWQPRYASPLSVDDAVTMILAVGRMYDVVARGSEP